MGKLHSQEVPFWKNTSILWVYPNLVGNMAVFVARFGYPIATPNLLHIGLKFLFWRLSEDVRARCCQRIWTTLHNHQNWTKNRPLRVKPSSGQKKINRTVFQVYIVVYLQQTSFDTVFRSMSFFGGDKKTLVFVGFYNPIQPDTKISSPETQLLTQQRSYPTSPWIEYRSLLVESQCSSITLWLCQNSYWKSPLK